MKELWKCRIPSHSFGLSLKVSSNPEISRRLIEAQDLCTKSTKPCTPRRSSHLPLQHGGLGAVPPPPSGCKGLVDFVQRSYSSTEPMIIFRLDPLNVDLKVGLQETLNLLPSDPRALDLLPSSPGTLDLHPSSPKSPLEALDEALDLVMPSSYPLPVAPPRGKNKSGNWGQGQKELFIRGAWLAEG